MPRDVQGRPISATSMAATSAPVWLRVGTLLDGTSTRPRRDVHVVYDANGIRFVGRDDELPPRAMVRDGQASPDVHAPDCTLLPGLIDAHVHLFLGGAELDAQRRAADVARSPAELITDGAARLQALARMGVVAVRDAGDKFGVGLALSRQRAEGGTSFASYVDSPGAAIHHEGRYGAFMAEPIEAHASLAGSVNARVAAGADRIKLIATGILNFKDTASRPKWQLTEHEGRELVDAARRSGRQTLAHASGDEGIDHVIDGGIDTVEHGFFVRDDQLSRMRDRRVAWVPTFAPVQAQLDHADLFGWGAALAPGIRGILDRHAESLCRAEHAGVMVIAGSDAGSGGVPHGIGLLRELELMELAGMSAISVVNSATGVSADRLSFAERFGKIAAGYRSRFILTRHSPLATVMNLRSAKIVVFDDQAALSEPTGDATGL